MFTQIDTLLNSITMYKLVLYGLFVIAGFGLLFSAVGVLSFSFLGLLASLLLLMSVSYLSNIAIGTVLKAPLSPESSIITALILFLILAPISSLQDVYLAIGTALIATVSKYIFAISKKHLFNPAAIGLVIMGLFGSGNAYWWVGSDILLPIVAIVGVLIVRKIRRVELVAAFVVSSIATILITRVSAGADLWSTLLGIFTSWPLVFFATVMLTEPQTTPPTHGTQIVYGGLVGIVFGLQFHLGPVYSTPELALVIGNIFSYLLSPKQKIWFTLQKVKKLSHEIYHFEFQSPLKLQFTAGQYLEWTLPHQSIDLRGNRRYFTVATSPTETNVGLGVKIIPTAASSFKKALFAMKPGDQIIGTQTSGSFTLPSNPNTKLAFIAGGIGVTPFRSMIKYLHDSNQKRDITLLYAAHELNELVYQDVFEAAKKTVGIQTVYVITRAENAPPRWQGLVGYLTADMIKAKVPDYLERTFYLSGPDTMVKSYQKLLATLKVPQTQIKTDYFSGY